MNPIIQSSEPESKLPNHQTFQSSSANQAAQTTHPLLKDAKILKSDYEFMRAIIHVWTEFVNLAVIYNFACYISPAARDYKREMDEISKLSNQVKSQIRTEVYGGETQEDFQELEKTFEGWRQTKMSHPDGNPFDRETKVEFFDESNSLKAARFYKDQGNVCITNFPNAVRVGGADRSLGKGSQEESLFRATALRVSLEEIATRVDQTVRELTGRYIPYYGVVISENIPTFDHAREKGADLNAKETFGYSSVAAPDLRKNSYRSEGDYFANESPELIREVLYRKLAVNIMAAAMHDYDILVVGAFGCGAFDNDPKMVAEVLEQLLKEPRFQGIFSHVVLPIGTEDKSVNRNADKNRAPFEAVFKSNPTTTV